MVSSKDLEIKINTKFEILPISFWNAIKLRLAGRNYQKLIEALSDEIKKIINKSFKEV